MRQFLLRWFVTVVGVLVASAIVPGITYDGLPDLMVAGLLLGFLNAVVKPILMILSLPFLILTLGLFTLVINAILLYWVGRLMPGFRVDSFWSAFLGGLVVSIASMFLNAMIGRDEPPRRPPSQPGTQPRAVASDDEGPIIDV